MYVFKELPPESMDRELYLDDEYYNETVYIVSDDRYDIIGNNLNLDEFKKIQKKAEYIEENLNKENSLDENKDIIESSGLEYSPALFGELMNWKEHYTSRLEGMAEYLSITTKREWDTYYVTGYVQGDYCYVIFREDAINSTEAKELGEIYLGCAREFSLTKLADDGTEEDELCRGYIVADSKAWDETGYKKVLCEMEGLNPNEVRLEMIR